ncbi:unnamed protein product, partial [Rotaria sordida]
MSDNNNTEIPSKTEEIVDVDPNETSDRNVTSSNNEENSNKPKFFQRFRGKTEDKKPPVAVSVASLFRYATMLDIIYMLLGTVGGLSNGILLPLMIVVFGGLLNSFTDRSADLCKLNFTALAIEYCPKGYQLTASNYLSSVSICHFNETTLDFQGEVKKQTLYLVGIGCASLVLGYIQIVFWSMAAERQTKAIRQKLFQSILRKE